MLKKSVLQQVITATVLIAMVVIVSCKKKTAGEVDGEQQSVVDNAIAEQEFLQILPNLNALAMNTKNTGAMKATAAGCDTLKYLGGDSSYVNAANPPKWEFDYSLGCSAAIFDGVSRSGKMQVTYWGKPKLAGSKAIIKLLSYKVNGTITYSCDSIIVTTTTVTATSYQYNVKVINGVATGSTGWTIKFNCDKNITINLNGAGGSDDVIIISGTADGVNRVGRSFHAVSNQLTKHANCKWISAGTLDLTPEGFSTRVVNYGENDVCDDQATYTINGQTIAFTLVK